MVIEMAAIFHSKSYFLAIFLKGCIKSRLNLLVPHSRFSSVDCSQAKESITFSSTHIKLLMHIEFKSQLRELKVVFVYCCKVTLPVMCTYTVELLFQVRFGNPSAVSYG